MKTKWTRDRGVLIYKDILPVSLIFSDEHLYITHDYEKVEITLEDIRLVYKALGELLNLMDSLEN